MKSSRECPELPRRIETGGSIPSPLSGAVRKQMDVTALPAATQMTTAVTILSAEWVPLLS
jgi:hypothetical protein